MSLALVGAVGCGDSGDSNMNTMDMAPSGPPVNESLVGTWNSESCESAGTLMGFSLYIKRSYVFTSPTEFQVTADLFGDAGCSSFLRLLRIDQNGTFKIGNDVSGVTGAKEADFAVSVRGVTANVSMATTLLNMLMCGGVTNWSVGMRVDISAAGCDPLEPSTSSCPTEHDLVQISNGTELKLGARPASTSSVCTARPTAVGPGLTKQ
jgi:hypothetical protein